MCKSVNEWCLGEVLVMLEEVLAGLEEVLVMLEEVLAMLEEVLVMLEEVLRERSDPWPGGLGKSREVVFCFVVVVVVVFWASSGVKFFGI